MTALSFSTTIRSKSHRVWVLGCLSPRQVCEHINRKLKIFKILSDRYRNRRKRFALRFNLIAGLYNYELRLSKTESV